MTVIRRIDCSPGDLLALINDAVRRAGCEAPADWAGLLRLLHQPQGVFLRSFPRGEGVPFLDLEAAWWDDPLGRRHWHIETQDASPDGPSFAGFDDIGLSEDDLRDGVLDMAGDPLGRIAPECSAFALPSGARVVVCRCAFAGAPESLAWMVDVCGPCRDREQEGLPPLGPPVLRPDPGTFDNFVLAPDGRLVTLRMGTPSTLAVWAPPYAGKPLWRCEIDADHAEALACGGGRIALSAGRRLTVLSLEDGSPTGSVPGTEIADNVQIAFAGTAGEWLLALGGSALSACPVDRRGRPGPPQQHLTGPFTNLAVSPDGARAGLAGPDGIAVLETGTWREQGRLIAPGASIFPATAAFCSGGVIVAGGGLAPHAHRIFRWALSGHGGGLLESRHAPEQSLPVSHPPFVLGASAGAVAVRAAGRGLDLFTASPLAPLAALLCASVLGDHGPIRFSPDGRSLLVLTPRGLAVYPWREMARAR